MNSHLVSPRGHEEVRGVCLLAVPPGPAQPRLWQTVSQPLAPHPQPELGSLAPRGLRGGVLVPGPQQRLLTGHSRGEPTIISCGDYFVVENGLLLTLTAKIVKTEAVLLIVLVSPDCFSLNLPGF